MINLKTNKPILSVGDVVPDIILPYSETRRVLTTFTHGETVYADHSSARIYAGGSVANTAHGIAVLGAKSWFAGKVGNDYFGRFLRTEFEKAGVDTRYLLTDDAIPTAMVIVVVGENGERINYAVPPHGASQHSLQPGDLPDPTLDQIGWLHTSGIMLRENPAAETILDLMRRCHANGIPTSLDLNFRVEAAGDREYLQRIHRAIPLTTVLLGSGHDELVPLTGAASPQAAAQLLATSDRLVVCRLGSQGADLYTEAGMLHHCPALDVPVVDTLGAGDAYNAGFITAVTQGLSLQEANLWGNAVAGYKIMHAGARNFPTRSQLEKFIQEHPAGK